MLSSRVLRPFAGLQSVIRAVALAVAITLFGAAYSAAGNPLPAAGSASAVNWSFEQRREVSGVAVTRLRATPAAWRHRVWVARFASFEMRIEWHSERGQDTWSVTIGRAETSSGTPECI